MSECPMCHEEPCQCITFPEPKVVRRGRTQWIGEDGKTHNERRISALERENKALREALRLYAQPKNWKCQRCGKHDPINCYCGLYEGPLPGWNGEPYADGDQPWHAAEKALAEQPASAQQGGGEW